MSPARVLLAALLSAVSPGCRRTSSLLPFAIRFVDVARSTGIPSDLVDEEMIERLHRAQLVQRAARARRSPEEMERAWKREPKLPASARSRLLRERASGAIRHTLGGSCVAKSNPEMRKRYLTAFAEPWPAAPDEANEERQRLLGDLEAAEVVRVTCESGALGLVALPVGGGWRVIDLFPAAAPATARSAPPGEPIDMRE